MTGEENIAAFFLFGSIVLYNLQTGTEIARLLAYEEPVALVAPVVPMEPIMPDAPPPEPTISYSRTFQLGDFSSFTDAMRLVSYMEGEGFKPFIEHTKVNNATAWRMVIDFRVFDRRPLD